MEYKIIASNLPNPKKVTLNRLLGQYLLLENNIFSKNVDYKIQENISAIALITVEQQSDFLGKVGMGILGNMLLGKAGAVAGVLCGGNTLECNYAMEVYPKWRLVATLDERGYKDLRALAKKNASMGKVLPGSELFQAMDDFTLERFRAGKIGKKTAPAPEKKLDVDDLPKLKQLLDAGIITQEEFNQVKKKALGL